MRWRWWFCRSHALLDLYHVTHDSRRCSCWAIPGCSGEGESREGPEVPSLDCGKETCFCRPAHRSMMIFDECSDAGEIIGSALVAHGSRGCRSGRANVNWPRRYHWRTLRWRCGWNVVFLAAVVAVVVVVIVYDVGKNHGRQVSGTRGGCGCEIETPHAGAMAFTPSLHDFNAGRVGDCDFLSGEDHGTACIAEYSHAEEIVCKCWHDGTGVRAWGQMW